MNSKSTCAILYRGFSDIVENVSESSQLIGEKSKHFKMSVKEKRKKTKNNCPYFTAKPLSTYYNQ